MFKLIPDPEKGKNPAVALGLLQRDQSCQIHSCRRFFTFVCLMAHTTLFFDHTI